MPQVAIAILETHADAVRVELLRNDPEQRFTSTSYNCARCGTTFTIFFMNGQDENNDTYATELLARIAVGCEMGRHPFEGYPLARP
jgi:hypothetical protein